MKIAVLLLSLLVTAPVAAQQRVSDAKTDSKMQSARAAELEKIASDAAERLMEKLDVNLDGIVDMRDAEALINQRIGPAQELAIQGAMRFDLNGDGKITPDEIMADARRRFDLLAGPNGRIAGRSESFEQYVEHDMAMFRMWDADHKGFVTRSDIERVVNSQNASREQAIRDEYRNHLRLMDRDRKGHITLSDMKSAFLQVETLPPPAPPATPSEGRGLAIERFVQIQTTEILKEFGADAAGNITHDQAVLKGGSNCYLLSMDEEGDGFITAAKIERRAKAAATVADVDHDGLLSRSEMVDAWAMLHGLKTWTLPASAANPAKSR